MSLSAIKLWMRDTVFLLVLASGLFVVLGSSVYLINHTANRLVAKDAERKSLAWANYIGLELNRIEEIAAGARLTEEEQGYLERIKQFGDIFRFKLFDVKGRLRLVSDDLNTPIINAKLDHGHSEKAFRVLQTGKPHINVGDGRKRLDRPDIYVECYVPVVRQGRTVAVVEVYVDQAANAAEIRSEFTWFGVWISTLILVAFLYSNGCTASQRPRVGGAEHGIEGRETPVPTRHWPALNCLTVQNLNFWQT